MKSSVRRPALVRTAATSARRHQGHARQPGRPRWRGDGRQRQVRGSVRDEDQPVTAGTRQPCTARRPAPARRARRPPPAGRAPWSTGTAGSASRFAGTAARLTVPLIAAMTGMHGELRRQRRRQRGRQRRQPRAAAARRSAAVHPGARTSSASVASTERAKPGTRRKRRREERQRRRAWPAAPAAAPADVPARSPPAPAGPCPAARSTLGVGLASSDEADQRSRRDQRPHADAQRRPPQQSEHRRHHHGQVGAADGRQVGQPGRCENPPCPPRASRSCRRRPVPAAGRVRSAAARRRPGAIPPGSAGPALQRGGPRIITGRGA